MNSITRISIQLLAWTALAFLVGAFARGPEFDTLPPGHGQLSLALAYLSPRLEPCRQLSEEERMALPPTRRVSEVCGRTRVPVEITLTLDDRTLLARTLEPGGLHGDGRIHLVEHWPLPAGDYRAELTLRSPRFDSPRTKRLSFILGPRAAAVIEVDDHSIRLANTGLDTTGGSP